MAVAVAVADAVACDVFHLLQHIDSRKREKKPCANSRSLMTHGGVQRKYGGKKFSKDMALLFAFYKSIPRHRAIKLNNCPINTLSLFVIPGDAASDLRSDFFQSHCHFRKIHYDFI